MSGEFNAAAFLGVFVTCRQVRDEVHFIVSVPAEKASEYLERIGGFPKPGESRWVAIARTQPTEEAGATRESTAHETSQPLETMPAHNAYSRRAGILSSNKMFWKFIEAPGHDPATFAASYIRHQCKVASRADILPGTEAATLFDSLELNFKLWENRPRYVETS